MAYYGGRGDYYRGDYYRGDLFGRIGAGIKGFATGGIGGAIAGLTAMNASGPKKPPAPPSGGIYSTPIIGGAATAVKKLLGGSTGRRPKKGEPGYRGRRMNPLNVKALRRADRRAHAFLKATRGIVRHYTAKAPKGKGYVHFKTKKR